VLNADRARYFAPDTQMTDPEGPIDADHFASRFIPEEDRKPARYGTRSGGTGMSRHDPEAPLRLATWNIHACVGRGGAFRPQRTARVLCELAGDVLALQEVEHHSVDGLDLLDYFSSRTGLTGIAGPTLRRGARHYGNALLTRLPVLDVTRVDLSIEGREPRGALDVLLGWQSRRLQVIATHLGLSPIERRRQVRRLLARVETRQADVVVLMGDLNEWLLWGRPLRWLRGHFPPSPQPSTWPASAPLFALDRIWARPEPPLHLDTHRSPLARIGSDHLPLKADLLPPAGC
jgi:endonuclease/exonuclease/phosphatase family metal-dependent hydrolase